MDREFLTILEVALTPAVIFWTAFQRNLSRRGGCSLEGNNTRHDAVPARTD